MKKEVINCSHCFLGNGYTAQIGYNLIKNNSILLSKKRNSDIIKLKLEEKFISPIPIFPVVNSLLSKKLDMVDNNSFSKLDISYSFKQENINVKKIDKGSLADYLSSNEFSKNWINTSLKQWGSSIFQNEYSEVKRKIMRHYGKKQSPRIGYHQGQSLYYHFLKNQNKAKTIFYNKILKINIEKKNIETDCNIIQYKKLISTIHMPELLDILHFNTSQDFSSHSAYFFYYRFEGDFKSNKMVYDCFLNSDILRVFSVGFNILMVQLIAHKKDIIEKENVENRIFELCPNIKKLKFIRSLFTPNCYPLESINENKLIQFKGYLYDNGVITFGRFGNWEYKDLHELNWNLI